MNTFMALYVVALLCTISYGFADGVVIASARIESCRGCQLNRLPEVKQFIYTDVPLYKDVEFKPIQGAPPELVLLNPEHEEVERLSLARLTRLECNELLESKGFFKKETGEEKSEL